MHQELKSGCWFILIINADRTDRRYRFFCCVLGIKYRRKHGFCPSQSHSRKRHGVSTNQRELQYSRCAGGKNQIKHKRLSRSQGRLIADTHPKHIGKEAKKLPSGVPKWRRWDVHIRTARLVNCKWDSGEVTSRGYDWKMQQHADGDCPQRACVWSTEIRDALKAVSSELWFEAHF